MRAIARRVVASADVCAARPRCEYLPRPVWLLRSRSVSQALCSFDSGWPSVWIRKVRFSEDAHNRSALLEDAELLLTSTAANQRKTMLAFAVRMAREFRCREHVGRNRLQR